MIKSIHILTFFIAISCANRNSSDTATASAALEALVLKKMEALNAHDLDAIGKFYADSAKIQSLGFEQTETGPEGVKGVYKRYFASTPDLKFEVTRMITTNETVVIEYNSGGTMQQSPLEAVIPEYMIGKKYTLRNVTRMDFKDGKIIGEMTYFDQLSFLRQMGFFDQK